MASASQQMDSVPAHVEPEESAPDAVTAVVDTPVLDTVKKAADVTTALKVIGAAMVAFALLVAASVKVLSDIPTRTETRADLKAAISPITARIDAQDRAVEQIREKAIGIESKTDAQQAAITEALRRLDDGQRELLRAVLRQGRTQR